MTRDFKNQRRDDVRPSSRNHPSGRHGEERPPRPARPRLNRETVDRAWETGAPQKHADYRPRSANQGQPPRSYGQRNQPFDRPSAQNSRNSNSNSRRPYEGRQENYRPAGRPSDPNRGPRPRSYDSGMRRFDEQRYNERRDHGHPDRPGESAPRPGFRENSRYGDTRRPYADRDRYGDRNREGGYQRRDFQGDRRQPRDFERDGRPPRNFERGDRGSPGYRGYRGDRGDRRDRGEEPQPDTRNPRWQSRPPTQHARQQQPQAPAQHAGENELFEGDYEHFNTADAPERQAGRSQPHAGDAAEEEQRHVTRLPDGRVLKGPRRVQRKNAQFWTDVAQETETLVPRVQQPETATEVSTPAADAPEAAPKKITKRKPAAAPKATTRAKPKTGAHKASAVARDRKPRSKESAPRAKAKGPRPSQKGFKWSAE